MPNRLMPAAPRGTRPISTRLPESFSHSSEPTAMEMVKNARIRVTTPESPARCSRVMLAICAR